MVDLDSNGFGDVWEQVYHANAPGPTANSDGDSQSDVEEEKAGTNPFDAESVLESVETRLDGGNVTIAWASQPGKSYRVIASGDLSVGSWTPLTQFQVATGTRTETVLPGAIVSGARRFFSVEVTDVDSDSDGVPDWDELQLPGFDPNDAQSANPGTSDLNTLTGMLEGSADTVTASAPVAVAVEKEAVNGVFRIARSGGLKAMTARFSLSGNANVQKGSASASDYTLLDAAGGSVSNSIAIPFGVASVDVVVRPAVDALIETPEALTLTISADAAYSVGSAGSAVASIADAANTAANERLFVAYLVPTGVGTSATGLSTIRLQGDNATGLVSLSFSGLTSPQTTAFLALDNTGIGAYVKGLPAGQVTDSVWTIKAAAYLASDQAMLDALIAGSLQVVVNTTNFLEGEIRGNFVASSGSTEPPAPGAPPAIETLTGMALKRDVARFLTQATFGPTQAEIDALTTQIETVYGGNRIAGYSAWIDSQFAMDVSSIEAYARAADAQEWSLRGTDPINYTTATGEPGSSNRRRAWWVAAVGARDQLRQRAAFALSEIFVISEVSTQVGSRHYGAAHYYDQLAAAANGNYRTLIEDISKSPMMGTYLSHLKNQKAIYDPVTGAVLISPDENYAREVMQLFSIGLVELHPDGSLRLSAVGVPIPTYSNADIVELARVLTGWSFSKKHGNKADGYPEIDNTSFNQSNGPEYFQASWLNPLKNFSTYHDTGAKTVLGSPIPAGLDGDHDLDAALDILFQHPNVAPFISLLLIQRLVTSTPSAGYTHRVTQKFVDDGAGTRGNLGAVIRAILLDPEARNLSTAAFVGFGKQKEPIIRYVQLLRAFQGHSLLPLADLSAFGYPADQLDNFAAGATRMRFGNLDTVIGQSPQASPTVFNWFLPRYSPRGAITAAGLVAPEMQITNETQIAQAVNFNRQFLNMSSGQSGSSLPFETNTTLDDVRIDVAPWVTLYDAEIADGKTVTEAVTTLVDQMDLLLMSGRLKDRYASAPVPNPRSSIISSAVSAGATERITNILYLMGNCPEYLHQK